MFFKYCEKYPNNKFFKLIFFNNVIQMKNKKNKVFLYIIPVILLVAFISAIMVSKDFRHTTGEIIKDIKTNIQETFNVTASNSLKSTAVPEENTVQDQENDAVPRSGSQILETKVGSSGGGGGSGGGSGGSGASQEEDQNYSDGNYSDYDDLLNNPDIPKEGLEYDNMVPEISPAGFLISLFAVAMIIVYAVRKR